MRMATLASNPAYRTVSAEEFVEMNFGDAKAELVDGSIYMMAGGTVSHAAIQANLVGSLWSRLRGSGCRPFGSDMAVKTGELNVRYPDVSVYCNDPAKPENAGQKFLGDPRVVIEVLSPSTATHDQVVKRAEYQALPGVDTILFVDPERQQVRVVQRTGLEGWSDNWLVAGADVVLPSLEIAVPHVEIFAVD